MRIVKLYYEEYLKLREIDTEENRSLRYITRRNDALGWYIQVEELTPGLVKALEKVVGEVKYQEI